MDHTRKRSDSTRTTKENRELRRENSKLRKQIQRLNGRDSDPFEEPIEQEAPQAPAPLTVTGKACSKCGGPTEEMDLGIRKYAQCLNVKAHRDRIS
jgi:hypothetical protein